MAYELDMTWVAGDTQQIQVSVHDENGVPVSLAGASINYALRAWAPATSLGAILVQKGPADILVNGANNEIFTIEIESADTVSLAGQYLHGAQLALLNGVVFTAFYGNVLILSQEA